MKHILLFFLLLICLVSFLNAENLFTSQESNPTRTDYIWWGNVSTNWHEPTNWSTTAIPNSASDVIINTGCTYYPYVNTADAFCNTLLIQNGAYLTVGGYDLTVTNNANIYGQLNMNNAGEFVVDGYMYWQSGATAAVTNAAANIKCHGNMFFQSGSDVQFEQGTVTIGNTVAFSYLQIGSANTEFCNLQSYAQGFSVSSDYDITINGDLVCIGNSWLTTSSEHNIYLKGNLRDENTVFQRGIKFYNGTLVLNGVTQHLSFATTMIGTSYLNNLSIQVSNSVILDSGLYLYGDLLIGSGTFSVADNEIWIRGSWINEIGPTAFQEGTSTVVFKGSEDQYFNNDENFYNLELDKSSGSFIVNSGTAVIECESYDWTEGTVTVMAGTFQANSLADNGISGSWHLTSSSGYI